MKYTIYIQALNNFPIADWVVSAYMGFRDRQADIVFFENIDEVPVSRMNIVVGYIEDTNKYLEKLGLPPKSALNIPKSIEKYAHRRICHTTMGGFRGMAHEGDCYDGILLPVFIKPDGKAKEFVAGVVKRLDDIPIYFREVPMDSKVLISDVVDFVSEYRGYVIDGQLKGIKHYIGDFRIFPDMKVVDAAIADYIDAPAGYSIDFGIDSEGYTSLIECNDGWSLGNYGLDNSVYTSLLCKRWLEMMKEK